MSLYHAHDDARPWLTLVVRADSEERARVLTHEASAQYGDVGDVTVEAIDPDGPEGIVVEDAS